MDLLKLAAKELGSRGGKQTSKKYGKKHYQRLAKNMNEKIAERKKGITAKNKAKIDPIAKS